MFKTFSDLSRSFTNPENLGEITRLYGERWWVPFGECCVLGAYSEWGPCYTR